VVGLSALAVVRAVDSYCGGLHAANSALSQVSVKNVDLQIFFSFGCV